jgi:nitrogen fixation/metabolism regulation signal transduction histidine kinase
VRNDLQRGLEIIEMRSASLQRFLEAYRKLAQMPKPNLKDVPLGALVSRVAALEMRVKVCVREGPEVTFQADPDQLEQMLINLIRNAADAVLENTSTATKKPCEQATHSEVADVVVRWDTDPAQVMLAIEDEGPGLLNPANVFTPFYTTKPTGSGVGLVLCRQIAEAHGGSIEISNRRGSHGCLVKVVLPRSAYNAAPQTNFRN